MPYFEGQYFSPRPTLKGWMEIRRIRSNKELAKILRVHRHSVEAWRKGRHKPHPNRLRQIAKLLHVRPEDLTLRDDRADQ